MSRQRRSISLFSGCGGLDLGLAWAGFDASIALDADPVAERSYLANFRDAQFHRVKIGSLSRQEIATLFNQQGPIDLLAGGPPCPSFSKSRFYRTTMPRAIEDPNGFETISGYLDVLISTRPRAFILENVKGLAYGVHRPALDYILHTARSAGYECAVWSLNAADYGVPQIRERCFVVGSLHGQILKPEATHANPEEAANLGLKPWEPVGPVLSNLPTALVSHIPGHVAGGRYHDLLQQIPPGDNYLYFTEKRGSTNPVFKWRGRYWSFLLKLSPARPSWTIQARRTINMGPFHWNSRILTIDEVKRIQSFPDDFQLHGTIEKQWRQLGNAVPPQLAYHCGQRIADFLSKYEAPEKAVA